MEGKTRRTGRKGVRRYLRRVPFLPSLLTLGNAFCGFLAIIKINDAARLLAGTPDAAAWSAAWHLVEVAGLLIFLGMVFDGLDGKIARLTRQTTEFGTQLDSLADVVTFGIAPAVIAMFLINVHQRAPTGEPLPFQYLPYHPKIYYVCVAIYALFAVLRLARFNVEVRDPEEKSHLEFDGMPSPAAATVVGALVLFLCAKNEKNSLSSLFFDEGIYQSIIVALPGVLTGCGLLMVSRFPYPHLLNRLLKGRKTFAHLVIAVFLLILIVLEWQIVLVTLSLLYVLTGPLIGSVRLLRGKPGSVDTYDEDEDMEGPEFDEPDVEVEPEEEPQPPLASDQGPRPLRRPGGI